MKMRSLGITAATVLLFGTSYAWAEHSVAPGEVDADISEYTGEGGESPLPPFSELDRNGDGTLDRDEVAHIDPLRRQFEAADIGQDGGIDQSEFSAFEYRIGVMPGVGGEEQQEQQYRDQPEQQQQEQ